MSLLPRAAFAVALLCLLTGCLVPSYPTQSHPVCSWDSNPPSNSSTVCDALFRTMSKALAISQQKDAASLRFVVSNPRTRRTIARYGLQLRRSGATGVHIVPSFTAKELSPGYYGAGIYILGKARSGRIKSQDTVYLRLAGGKAMIADDQPAQDW